MAVPVAYLVMLNLWLTCQAIKTLVNRHNLPIAKNASTDMSAIGLIKMFSHIFCQQQINYHVDNV